LELIRARRFLIKLFKKLIKTFEITATKAETIIFAGSGEDVITSEADDVTVIVAGSMNVELSTIPREIKNVVPIDSKFFIFILD